MFAGLLQLANGVVASTSFFSQLFLPFRKLLLVGLSYPIVLVNQLLNLCVQRRNVGVLSRCSRRYGQRGNWNRNRGHG